MSIQYNQLGDSDLNVSNICLGTMTYGQQNTKKEAHQQLDYAFDQGINFIDTVIQLKILLAVGLKKTHEIRLF